MEAKIDNFNSWVHSSDEDFLKKEVERLLEKSGFTILKFMEHRFDPQGYTAIWLLAESHCALHSFPEENKTYIELSSCNSDLFVNFIVAYNAFQKQFSLEI